MNRAGKNVSLETARKLFSAGYPQGGSRWYCHDDRDGKYHLENLCIKNGVVVPLVAPDLQELTEALPIITFEGAESVDTKLRMYIATYFPPTDKEQDVQVMASEPCEALAILWLELRKQKLI